MAALAKLSGFAIIAACIFSFKIFIIKAFEEDKHLVSEEKIANRNLVGIDYDFYLFMHINTFTLMFIMA